MEKCKNCNKEMPNEKVLKCKNCGAKLCPNCADMSIKICPYCYRNLD